MVVHESSTFQRVEIEGMCFMKEWRESEFAGRRIGEGVQGRPGFGERGEAMHDDRGTGAVEAAIVVPVIMVVFLVVIQMVIWVHAANVVQTAAARGDRVARAFGSNPQEGVLAARSTVAELGSKVVHSVVVSSGTEHGGMVVIRVEGQAETVLPWFHIHVQAFRMGPVQRFRASE
jgi:hypothetical protein